jgi:hypothetical protein
LQDANITSNSAPFVGILDENTTKLLIGPLIALEIARSADALDQLAVLNVLRDSKPSSSSDKLIYLMPA